MSDKSTRKVEFEEAGDARVLEASDGGMTISVPIRIKRRSGRRLITLPDGTTEDPRPWDTEPTKLQLALARGHRWLRMLESGEVSSLREIAEAEGVDSSYVGRMLNLTLLAPDLVDRVLNDDLVKGSQLHDLAIGLAVDWGSQRSALTLLEQDQKITDQQICR